MSGDGRRVLVTGAEHPGGLAALRALREADFLPWAAITSGRSYGAQSRSAEGSVLCPDPAEDQEGFARRVAQAASEIGAAAVLPGTEAGLLAVSKQAHLFNPQTRLGAPPPDIVEAALDKEHVSQVAEEVGLDVPRTTLLRWGDSALRPSHELFPAVVKPVRSELRVEGGVRRFEVSHAWNEAQLEAAVTALPDSAALIQPYIPGPLFTVNGVARDGRVVETVHKRAQRTFPLDCGPVCRAVTVGRKPELDAGVRALILRLRWSGIFNLQFIEASDRDYLIDLNPRLYHSLALAVAAGANLPALHVSMLLDGEAVGGGYRTGVHFRSLDDLRATRTLLKRRNYRRATAGMVPGGRVVCPILSTRDPEPWLNDLRRAIRRTVRRLTQSMSNKRRRTRSAP